MTNEEADQNKFSDKWSPEIAAKGHTSVPNCLIRCQKEIGITTAELNVLLQVMLFRYDRRDPFPSMETIATGANVTPRTARRNIASLEDKGLIKRDFCKRSSSTYGFFFLIDKLNDHIVVCEKGGQKQPPNNSKNLSSDDDGQNRPPGRTEMSPHPQTKTSAEENELLTRKLNKTLFNPNSRSSDVSLDDIEF